MLSIDASFPNDIYYVNPIVFKGQDYFEAYNIYTQDEPDFYISRKPKHKI